MKDTYKVGYGKPPKASQFGYRPQPDRSAKSDRGTKTAVDVAATLNCNMKVSQRGATVRMHPHEAMMLGLAKTGARRLGARAEGIFSGVQEGGAA